MSFIADRLIKQDQVDKDTLTTLMLFSMRLFKKRKGNNTSAVKRTGRQIYRQQRSGVTMLDAYKECFFLSGASLTLTMSTAFQHTHTVQCFYSTGHVLALLNCVYGGVG